MFTNNQICFILSALGDSHQRSRVLSFKKKGFIPTVWGIKRKGYKVDDNTEQFIQIGDISNNSLIGRFKAYLAVFFKYTSLRKSAFSHIYIFGLDNLLLYLIAMLFSSKPSKIIYEVPDIQPFQYRVSLSSRILQFLEKRAISKVDLVIVTSPEFITGYYETFLKTKIKNYHLLENKVHVFEKEKEQRKLRVLVDDISQEELADKIVIGYFGLLRCSYTLDFLMQLAEKSDRFIIVTRGFFLGHTSSYLERIEASEANIYYLGKYISPGDLKLIYNEIDISWVAYPYSSEKFGNWKWARTNRYYEAGFFQKPMIALEGTPDAQNVIKNKIGIAIDLSSFDGVSKQVNLVTKESLAKWQQNIQSLPIDRFQVGKEYDELFEKIQLL